MAEIVRCPKCSKPYRVGDDVPAEFTCRACGTSIDLSRQVAAAERHAIAERARARLPSRGGTPAAAKVGIGVAGAIAIAMFAVRSFGRLWSSHEEERLEETQRRLDEIRQHYVGPIPTPSHSRPTLTITSPEPNAHVGTAYVRIVGTLENTGEGDTLYFNERAVQQGGKTFSIQTPVAVGENTISVSVIGEDGSTVVAPQRITITRSK